MRRAVDGDVEFCHFPRVTVYAYERVGRATRIVDVDGSRVTSRDPRDETRGRARSTRARVGGEAVGVGVARDARSPRGARRRARRDATVRATTRWTLYDFMGPRDEGANVTSLSDARDSSPVADGPRRRPVVRR